MHAQKQFVVFDCEIVGKHNPVFLVCTKNLTTGVVSSFWAHKKGHIARLERHLLDPRLTFVGFNSNNFDAPLICAAIQGYDPMTLKVMATRIIHEGMNSWQAYRDLNIEFIEFDHIDIMEVAPGVMISLKTYAGRMGYPTMMDMPFDHDQDLTPLEQKVLERYCRNDIGVTEWLFDRVRERVELRTAMSEQYGIDLRSKSDAQMAEAILKETLGINNRDKLVPAFVRYRAPDFIQTKDPTLLDLIDTLHDTRFMINRGNGSPETPEWMDEEIPLGKGTYKVGIGGLHSTHDKGLYLEASDKLCLSDFDVASYYPNLIMRAGLVPYLGGNRGARFLQVYRELYESRIEAKRKAKELEAKDKKKFEAEIERLKAVDKSLKILLNGAFGKLGSIYSVLYSPDLMLAVTITGQLNLLCLIAELESIRGVTVYSANTDGVGVAYPPAKRDAVLRVFVRNAKRTGFEYEETRYRKYAAKDVNNYIAITTSGMVKSKGLYAEKSLEKNPTMQVCADAAAAYLKDGTDPITFILDSTAMEDFVAIRNVKGGGVQHLRTELVDDWVLVEDHGNAQNLWHSETCGKSVKRKSRPAPVEVGVGGVPFGRVARWYMTTEQLPPITYVGSGNMVPKTTGAKLCLILPATLPKDLDLQWYIDETWSMLADMGVKR